MRRFLAPALAVSVLLAPAARAETLDDLARARGIPPPGPARAGDRPLIAPQVLDDAREVLVVSIVDDRQTAVLRAARFDRASGEWTIARLAGPPPGGGPDALPIEHCRSGLAIERFPAGFLLRAHINPSAECTMVLGSDLTVRAVLAGWPVTVLADGRLVYQRNQVHFAAVHPVGLALFDPRGPSELTLYPPRPDGPARAAHVARMRAIYTPGWCAAHNHPCDPEVFDEEVRGEIVADVAGDALAFVMAWDNTVGWSDAERWGRLEPFRELRPDLGRWDGQAPPPAALYRDLAAGLARAGQLEASRHVADAMAGEPLIAPLLAAALAGRPASGQDARAWLLGLDPRWADPETWRRLARAIATPDEFTEVVYVYSGLRHPTALRHREMLRRDFELRFGPGAPRRALEPDVLRAMPPPAPGTP